MYALVIYNNISSFQVPVYYMTVLKNRRKRNFKKKSQISISLYTYLPDSSVKVGSECPHVQSVLGLNIGEASEEDPVIGVDAILADNVHHGLYDVCPACSFL